MTTTIEAEPKTAPELSVWRVTVLYDALRNLVIEDVNRAMTTCEPMSKTLVEAVNIVDAVDRSRRAGRTPAQDGTLRIKRDF